MRLPTISPKRRTPTRRRNSIPEFTEVAIPFSRPPLHPHQGYDIYDLFNKNVSPQRPIDVTVRDGAFLNRSFAKRKPSTFFLP